MAPLTLLLALSAASIASASSLNLTITFTPDNLDTCATPESPDSITFTTSSFPDQPECFNLHEIFTSNSTTGIRNATRGGNFPYQNPVIWTVTNGQAYNPATNYSQILYQQTNGTVEEGKLAGRRSNAYPALDCSQAGDDGENLWYGYETTCQSSEEGECYRTNRGIQSFLVSSWHVGAQEKCLDWKFHGGAGRPDAVGLGALMVVMGVVAIGMVW